MMQEDDALSATDRQHSTPARRHHPHHQHHRHHHHHHHPALIDDDGTGWVKSIVHAAQSCNKMFTQNNSCLRMCHVYAEKQVEFETKHDFTYKFNNSSPVERAWMKTGGPQSHIEIELYRQFLFDEESVAEAAGSRDDGGDDDDCYYDGIASGGGGGAGGVSVGVSVLPSWQTTNRNRSPSNTSCGGGSTTTVPRVTRITSRYKHHPRLSDDHQGVDDERALRTLRTN